MGRIWFARNWRIQKIFAYLLIIEFPFTVACLTLMGVAHPDTYRDKLWQNGADKGFNSAPNSILYAYANWETPTIPLVWSHYMTEFNVVISLLSMFILLVKSAMFILHCFIPVLSVFVHALLVALYCVSIYNQSRPDLSDPNSQQLSMPWYLQKGCSYATPGNKSYCLQARASFAVVVVMMVLFLVYLCYSLWCVFPTAQERAERIADHESAMEMKKLTMYGSDPELSQEERREANRQLFMNLPKTPNTPGFGQGGLNPMTPRTVAFTALNGVPPTPRVVNTAGPGKQLPFREYELQTTSGDR